MGNELIAIVLVGSLLAIAVKFAFYMPELTLKPLQSPVRSPLLRLD
jgi:hypothetical protein